MADKRLFISDLDGTLLNSRGELSPETRDGLTYILSQGIPFTVASARNVVSIQMVFEGIPLALPVIAGGGAYLSDLTTGEHSHINALHTNLAKQVFSVISEADHTPFIGSYGIQDFLSYFERTGNPGMEWYLQDRMRMKDRRLRKIDHTRFFHEEHIVSFIVIDRLEKMTALKILLEKEFPGLLALHVLENLYSRGWYWLTIHDHRSRKDAAAEILLRKLGLSGTHLTVFGDNVNDLDLFSLAGRAVAVGNAEEVVKERATEIIGSNEENSVVSYIMKECNITIKDG